MSEKITVSDFIPAPPEAVFDGWIDGTVHTHMTGGEATSEPRVGGRFTAWDEYIEGAHRELERPRLVVQSWRSTEFPDDAPDSLLIVRFEPEGEGTRLLLDHSEIPEGQGASYEQGWKDHYFEPMKRYFAKQAATASAPPSPASKAAAEIERFFKHEPAPTPAKAATPTSPAKPAPARKAAAKKPARKAAKKAAPKRAAAKKPARKAAKKPARKPAKAAARKAAAKRPAHKAAAKKKPARRARR